MNFVRHMYREGDYWRLRAFLREVFVLNHHHEANWQAARLDYWRYFGNEHMEHYALAESICQWETADGCIVGFIVPERRGHAYLQTHPAFRTPELEAEMMDAAEEMLMERDDSGQCHLTLWAHQTDDLRIQMLQKRGYKLANWHEHQFRRSLEEPLTQFQPAPGYRIRALGDTVELPARSWLSWQVFHPDEPDEKYGGWKWYLDVQRCPLYRRDLDLVATTPDGELAAFCTVWYDDVTRTGYFEPVGTSPDHQRKGLGRAMMTEALHRLKHMGAIYATVAGYSGAALALYSSVMSPDAVLERWYKTL